MTSTLRVLALGIPLLLAGCGGARDEAEVQQAAQRRLESDAGAAKRQLGELRGVTMKDSELSGGDAKGRPLWRVAAKEIRVFNEPEANEQSAQTDESEDELKNQIKQMSRQPKRAELKDARALLYKNGVVDSSFRAPRVVINYTKAGVRMVMSGGVAVQSSGKWVGNRGPVALNAPRAQVNVKSRRLWADGGVRLVQGAPNQRIHVLASQVQANTDLKTTRLLGGVKAGSPMGAFAAKQAAWNWETNRASASGNVTATHEGTTITGSHLDADAAAGRGVLRGGVRASGEQGKASAGSVRYDWKNHRITAAGGVLLDKGEATMQAANLETDDKFNSAVASGDVTLKKDDATLRAGRIETTGKGAQATASGGVVLTRGDARVSASRATAYDIGEKNGRVVASGDVRVTRGEWTLTAGSAQASGLGDKSTLRVVASDGVYVRGKDGSVRAGRATWGGGRVVASRGVTLLRDGHRLSGSRLTCDDKFTQAVLSGDVNGRLAKGERVGAGTLHYLKGGGVKGRDGVSARSVYRGQTLRLRADSFDATPDGNHLVLTGNVMVSNQDGTRVLAREVRYDRIAEKIYASGDVYLQDPNRGLRQRGRKLVADLRLEQATLTDVSGSGKMGVFNDLKVF